MTFFSGQTVGILGGGNTEGKGRQIDKIEASKGNFDFVLSLPTLGLQYRNQALGNIRTSNKGLSYKLI